MHTRPFCSAVRLAGVPAPKKHATHNLHDL
jgi:hypothetical protein